jgi:hypothetical protein
VAGAAEPVAGAAEPVAGAARPEVPGAPRRAGRLLRVIHGAAHRARLLAASQWFAAPALVFLAVLGIIYASPVGPLLPAAALTAAVLAAIMTWVSVLAHLSDGRLMARAFAAHVGGRWQAHLAASLATVPFAVVATVVAVAWPALSQLHSLRHDPSLIQQIILLHLAAAVFGVGLGALLVPPLVERAGWRICLAAALFLALLLVPVSPVRPLLLLATHTGAWSSVGTAAGLLAGTGAVLVGLTAYLAARLP